MWPGVKEWWGLKYNELPETWNKIFEVDTSTKSYEEDVEGTGFGLAPVKSEGAAVSYDSEQQGATTRYTNVVYGLGYIVTQEEMEDSQYVALSKRRAERLAFSMKQTKETVHANIFNRAFSSSYTGGDGKELLATDHPTLNGTQSNELATAGDLSEASLEDLCVQIMNATNSRGMRIQIKPRKLIVPPALHFDARRILESELQNDSANNAKNVVGGLFNGVVTWQFLSDTDAWFIQTDAPRGLVHFKRREIKFEQDNDFDTNNAKAKSTERYSAKWSDWRGLYGTPGS